jgi:hypothetical protein
MERRDFVRRLGIAVALLTGYLGGGETPKDDGGDGNTTENGDGDGDGNQTDKDDGDAEQNGDGEDEDESNGEDDRTATEETGYTEFMYDPERASLEAEGYFFTYTDTGASQEMSERFQTADTGRTARIEIKKQKRVRKGARHRRRLKLT